jgi:predicted RNA-binding Zn ribbon-like protein
MTEIPPPAPGADRYPALDLVNSALVRPEGEHDLLATPDSARRWLADRGLVPTATVLHAVCAGRLRDLRGHVRALLAARVDAAAPPITALQAVNEALTRAPSADLLRWDAAHGLHRAPAHPVDQIVDHALATLAADAAELLTGPDAVRLAACGSPPCRRYLVRTHAARHWCSVRCGDRARAARAYARRKGG